MEEKLTQEFKRFAAFELVSLSELVDFYLSKEPPVTEYDKQFFTVMTAYSFIKTDLDIFEHGLPSIYISSVLDRFATRQVEFNGDLKYFYEVLVQLEQSVRWEHAQLSEFCDNFIFLKGLYPKAFEKKLIKPEFYQTKVKHFFTLFRKKPNDMYSKLSTNLDSYIHALNYMSQELLEGRYL